MGGCRLPGRLAAGGWGRCTWERQSGWRTNLVTQIKWGLGYIRKVYGNPCDAWAFNQANGYC